MPASPYYFAGTANNCCSTRISTRSCAKSEQLHRIVLQCLVVSTQIICIMLTCSAACTFSSASLAGARSSLATPERCCSFCSWLLYSSTQPAGQSNVQQKMSSCSLCSKVQFSSINPAGQSNGGQQSAVQMCRARGTCTRRCCRCSASWLTQERKFTAMRSSTGLDSYDGIASTQIIYSAGTTAAPQLHMGG